MSSALAIMGLKLGEKVRDNIYDIQEFIIIDLFELKKVRVGFDFIKENYYRICNTLGGLSSYGVPHGILYSEMSHDIHFKDKVYTDGKNLYCCDSIDDILNPKEDTYCFTYNLIKNGIVIINIKIMVDKDKCIAYTAELREDFIAIVYKPHTDEIEICYRKTLDKNNYMYIKFSDDSLFARSNDVVSVLVNDYTPDLIYEKAEKIKDIYRLGNVCWLDNDATKTDLMILGAGCKAFYILEGPVYVETLVIPPSIEFMYKLTFGCIRIKKLCISNVLRGSGIDDRIKSIVKEDFDDSIEVEWY